MREIGQTKVENKIITRRIEHMFWNFLVTFSCAVTAFYTYSAWKKDRGLGITLLFGASSITALAAVIYLIVELFSL